MKHYPILGALASSALAAPSLLKRAEGDCGSRNATVNQHLASCASRSLLAQEAATSGPKWLMDFFFKTDDKQSRGVVADLFGKIAAECGTEGGSCYVTCGESCNGFNAYTTWVAETSKVRLCEPYFSMRTATCQNLDSASEMIHEMSHAKGSTSDFNGAYGLNAIRSLDGSQNIQHAETYAFFAHWVALNCTQADNTPQVPVTDPKGAPSEKLGDVPNSILKDGPSASPSPSAYEAGEENKQGEVGNQETTSLDENSILEGGGQGQPEGTQGTSMTGGNQYGEVANKLTQGTSMTGGNQYGEVANNGNAQEAENEYSCDTENEDESEWF
ncbi:hypothetical protein DCS_08218 [Drechmeria coniospora]|uniref:deuterolysin n=1 Tax=Drechmeria coniospora TaxID=98403 RepID=A0A151GGL9_DRECN|nr:hypothetical protein DCS_08218 [Drechmeria coniospora]KYK56248.1 hypothetical protein DCS_08218 [Drechmeria coniospora]